MALPIFSGTSPFSDECIDRSGIFDPSFDLSRDSGKLLGSRLGAKEELENDFHVGRIWD